MTKNTNIFLTYKCWFTIPKKKTVKTLKGHKYRYVEEMFHLGITD